LVFWYTERA